MKKLFVVFLVCAGLLIALPALASDWTVTLNYAFGDAETEQQPLTESSDLDGFLLGLELPADPWGFGLMYVGGGLDEPLGGSDDFSLANIWVGRRIFQSGAFQLDVALSYATMDNGDYSVRGPILGLVGSADLGSGWSLQGGLGHSIGGVSLSNSLGDFTSESLANGFLKLGYEFANNWGLDLACYEYRYDGDNGLGELNGKTQLYTLGVTYRFGNRKPAEEPVKEEPKEEPKVEEPKEEPAKEEPKVEEPVKEEIVEEPVKEEPVEEPKVEEPVKEEPAEEPKVEEPVKEEPKVETKEEKEERIKIVNEFLHPIFFDFDEDVIRPDQLPYLWQCLKVIKENPDLNILIAGHADPPGSDEYNKKLSERRAWRICDWLIANGVDGSKIMIVGYGEEYPYMALSNDPNWESDRWVDIVLSDTEITIDMGIRK